MEVRLDEQENEVNKKRITDLISHHIMNQTQGVFRDEIRTLLKSTNFMRRVTDVAETAVQDFDKEPVLRAVMDLFCRNRELAHFSIVCLLNGGYAVTKVLSRAMLENFLLIRLFNLKPELAEEWFSTPKLFRKKWKPKEIRKAVFSSFPTRLEGYRQYYEALCDYAHPSFDGWIEQMERKNNSVLIACSPQFNGDYASESIGLICFAIVQSVKGFRTAFKKWYSKDLQQEEDALMQRVVELVRRYFEVRFYHKEQMLK